MGYIHSGWDHNITDYAWEYLEEHPALLIGLLTKMDLLSRVKYSATREKPAYRRTTEELIGSLGRFEFCLKPQVNSFLCSFSQSVPLVEPSVT